MADRHYTTTDAAIVIATRNRPDSLARCLRSIAALSSYPAHVIVVDSASSDSSALDVVTSTSCRWPVRYVRTEQPGLAHAHNVALAATDAAILAFTDDDVEVDRRWLEHLIDGFNAAPDVACVTGRIVAAELRTDAQRMLEAYAGYEKGPRRQIFGGPGYEPADPLFPYTAGVFGSGANMAFTAAFLEQNRGFDPALGAGTRARGADDLAAFFDVVTLGYRLVYEPAAVIHHHHPAEMADLERQVYGYGVGFGAFVARAIANDPARLGELIKRLPRAARFLLAADSPKNARAADDHPRRLVWKERLGMALGPAYYAASRWERRDDLRLLEHRLQRADA